MDIQRLKRLSGQYDSLSEMWKEVKVDTSTAKSTKASAAKTKENNKDVGKNKAATEINSNKDKIAAELIDIDDSSITPEEGKMDAAGQKAQGKTERQFHTVVIGDNGAPNVSDETEIEELDTETWNESIAFVVTSEEGKVYVAEMTETNVVGVDNVESALLFKTLEEAQEAAERFEIAEVRQVTLKEAVETTEQNPLVTVWEGPESDGPSPRGIVGHMNLSTFCKIHGCSMDGLASEVLAAGPGTRIPVQCQHPGEQSKTMYIECSEHNTDHFDYQPSLKLEAEDVVECEPTIVEKVEPSTIDTINWKSSERSSLTQLARKLREGK
jgi:hypothetical protein